MIIMLLSKPTSTPTRPCTGPKYHAFFFFFFFFFFFLFFIFLFYFYFIFLIQALKSHPSSFPIQRMVPFRHAISDLIEPSLVPPDHNITLYLDLILDLLPNPSHSFDSTSPSYFLHLPASLPVTRFKHGFYRARSSSSYGL